MRLALAAQVELTGCLRFDMTRMLYRAARTSQKIGASKPLEFRTFSKAARSKTMRGDTKVLFNTTFTGHKCYNCYKKPNRSKQSTGPGGKCKGSLGSRAEVSSSSFSCPRERLWDWNIMHYIYIYTYIYIPILTGQARAEASGVWWRWFGKWTCPKVILETKPTTTTTTTTTASNNLNNNNNAPHSSTLY